MNALLFMTLTVGAPPTDAELARAAVAVQVAMLSPAPPDIGPADEITGPAPPGQEWKRYPGQSWKLYPIAKAPEVAAPSGASFPVDRSHTCAKCGREQRTVAGFNRDGTHTHVCPSCGHSWRH